MSEDISEGEKGDTVGDVSAHGDSTKGGKMPRISSADVMENLANQLKEKKLYIVLIRHELKPSLTILHHYLFCLWSYNELSHDFDFLFECNAFAHL